MAVQFYNVKTKSKVDVDEGDVKKKKYNITTKTGKQMVRFGLVAEVDGAKLTKFVSQADWDSLDVPEVS